MDPIPQLRDKLYAPTVKPFENFNLGNDVGTLRSSLNTKGDEITVINLLTHRSFLQRNEILGAYKERVGRDLMQDVSSAFSSKSLKVLLAMLEPPNEFLCKELDKAFSGLRTDDEVISEILVTRSNTKIVAIQTTFNRMYGKTISSALATDHNLSSGYKELVGMLLGGSRHEAGQINREKANKRAASIHNAVEEGWSTATKIFTRLLTHESFDQLCVIFDEYRSISGIAMEEAIKSTFSGDIGYACLSVVRSAINKSQYYAETMETALQKKLRRDDSTLIRIIVTRCEVDLEAIKKEYLKIYHKTLYNGFRTEMNGSYREVMLGLLGLP